MKFVTKTKIQSKFQHLVSSQVIILKEISTERLLNDAFPIRISVAKSPRPSVDKRWSSPSQIFIVWHA